MTKPHLSMKLLWQIAASEEWKDYLEKYSFPATAAHFLVFVEQQMTTKKCVPLKAARVTV